MSITTTDELLNAVQDKQSDIIVSGKLAKLLNWSLISSQTSLFVRLPVIMLFTFMLLIAGSKSDTPLYVNILLILSATFIFSSMFIDRVLAFRIGYSLAKTTANRYRRISFNDQELVLKLRTDI